MNVLILNGSPRINGNTSIAIREMDFKSSRSLTVFWFDVL